MATRPRSWWLAHVGDFLRMSTADFAAHHRVNYWTAHGWRWRLGIPSPNGPGRPRGRKSGRWAGVDWRQSNSAIARELGVTPEAARQQREAEGLPPRRKGRKRKRRA